MDVDTQVAIAANYNIQSIPTFLFVNKGSETNRLIGLLPKDDLKAEIEKII